MRGNLIMKDGKINQKIRELIILCLDNIKGNINKEIIDLYLPIKIKDINIYQEENRIIFSRNNEEIADVWLDCNGYSNIEILKNITPLYGIECKSEELLELMKYRNKIILMLL